MDFPKCFGSHIHLSNSHDLLIVRYHSRYGILFLLLGQIQTATIQTRSVLASLARPVPTILQTPCFTNTKQLSAYRFRPWHLRSCSYTCDFHLTNGPRPNCIIVISRLTSWVHSIHTVDLSIHRTPRGLTRHHYGAYCQVVNLLIRLLWPEVVVDPIPK